MSFGARNFVLLAAAVLGLSGFASLLHEIVWTRILSLLLGPTVYAFSATLAIVIAGLALGSGASGSGSPISTAMRFASGDHS